MSKLRYFPTIFSVLAVILSGCASPAPEYTLVIDTRNATGDPSGGPTRPLGELVKLSGADPVTVQGYGLVIGLEGTGDSTEASREWTYTLIRDSGIVNLKAEYDAGNVAFALVTARLSPFQKARTTVDVDVRTVGNARSISGGMLTHTRLVGFIPGVSVSREHRIHYVNAWGSIVSEEAPTSGLIKAGGLVYRELLKDLVKEDGLGRRYVRLLLKKPDVRTAANISRHLNRALIPDDDARPQIAFPRDPGMVDVLLPKRQRPFDSSDRQESWWNEDAVWFVDRLMDLEIPTQQEK